MEKCTAPIWHSYLLCMLGFVSSFTAQVEQIVNVISIFLCAVTQRNGMSLMKLFFVNSLAHFATAFTVKKSPNFSYHRLDFEFFIL